MASISRAPSLVDGRFLLCRREAYKDMAKYEYWTSEEGCLLVEGWARDGLTDEQIAHNIGVRRETIYDWKKKYPNFSNALKKGKEVIDRQVENALLQSALGFQYREQTVTNQGNVVDVEKYEKPNTTAQIFWLKNRKPNVWRDKQEIAHEGTQQVRIVNDLDD